MTHVTRRQTMLASAAFAAAFALGPRGGHAADLRKLKFGVGLKAMGPAVISTLIGEGLGYNAEEGHRPGAAGHQRQCADRH